MSKCQFKIVRNSIRVFLRDKSFNSIWENCIKLVKDNMWPLKHNSEFCFAGKKKKVFVLSSFNGLNKVRILQSVNHPCIRNLEDLIDTPNFLFIVLELAEGGELFYKIIEEMKMKGANTKLYFFQIA